MDDTEIILRIQKIANGFTVTGSRSLCSYKHASLPYTYVATRDDVLAALPSLFDAAEALTEAEATQDDF